MTTKSQLDNYYRWVEPEGDIVCLRPDMVDRLQLDVLCAIDSSSRSGMEVGGILLGRTELDEGRTITLVDDFESVPCEHHNGPFYVLTAKDTVNFEAAVVRGSPHMEQSVVGYYRSHNRNGMFLSADDLGLIERYFRAPHNVFLLVKTLRNRACTAGFFFWKNGDLQSEFTSSEVPLVPISVSSPGGSCSISDGVDEITVAPKAHDLPATEERLAMTSTDSIHSDLHRHMEAHAVPSGVCQKTPPEVTEPAANVRPDKPETQTAIRLARPEIPEEEPGGPRTRLGAIAGKPQTRGGPARPKSEAPAWLRGPETLPEGPKVSLRTEYVERAARREFLEMKRSPASWNGLLRRLRSESDRRSAKRESGEGLSAFYFDGGRPCGHRVRDISRQGAFVETDFSWTRGTQIVVTLQIESVGDLENRHRDVLAVHTEVVRMSPEGMGLKFQLRHLSDFRTLFQFLHKWNPNSARLLLGE